MRKKARLNSDDRSFAFGFVDPNTSAETNKESSPSGTGAVSSPPLTQAVHPALGLCRYATREGNKVELAWEDSNHFRLAIRQMRPKQGVRYVNPSELQPERMEVKSSADIAVDNLDRSILWQQDLVTSPLHRLLAPPILDANLHTLVYPLQPQYFYHNIYRKKCLFCTHDAGSRTQQLCDDLCGLNMDAIVQQASRIVVWMKSVDRAHPTTGRLGAEKEVLRNDPVPVQKSHRKTAGQQKQKERVQYVDVASPEVALACYRAGHTLYLNPPIEVQRKWIRGVLRDLGMCVGGGVEKGLGGDVEVFANLGQRQITPWHFDAQDGFTIQLRGRKKWSFCQPSIVDPLTNHHPMSSNLSSQHADRALHAACGVPHLAFPAQYAECSIQQKERRISVIMLRPGSVLFVPAGMWHQVEDMADHPQGSLSVNLSLDPCRYGHLLSRSLGPLLWGPESQGARHRVVVGEGEEGLGKVLRAFKEKIAKLELSDLLPPCVQLGYVEGGESESEEEGDEGSVDKVREGWTVVGIESMRVLMEERNSVVLVRSPLAAMSREKESASCESESEGMGRQTCLDAKATKGRRSVLDRGQIRAWIHRGFGLGTEQENVPDFSVEIEVPPGGEWMIEQLAGLAPGEGISAAESLRAWAQRCSMKKGEMAEGVEDGVRGRWEKVVYRLFGFCLYFGYLRDQPSSVCVDEKS